MRALRWVLGFGAVLALYVGGGASATPPVSGGCRLVPTVSAKNPFGYKVFAIVAGSDVERDGFKVGDLIEKIDGEPVSRTDSDAIFAHTNVLGTRFTVLRKGQLLELRVTGR